MNKVDFDVPFFYGENETNLFNMTFNDLDPSDMEKFKKALQEFADANQTAPINITNIYGDGCEDVIIEFTREGKQKSVVVCSETTFSEMCKMMDQT